MSARRLALLALLLGTGACGRGNAAAPPPVQQEAPDVAIARVGTLWNARLESKTLESAPSPIAVRVAVFESTVRLEPGKLRSPERLAVSEHLELRDGTSLDCSASGEADTSLEFGRRGGEPAVEMRRPGLILARSCSADGVVTPELEVPATAARFVLRGDRLLPFEPPLEKRVYLPGDP